jgi:hypothetical protein
MSIGVPLTPAYREPIHSGAIFGSAIKLPLICLLTLSPALFSRLLSSSFWSPPSKSQSRSIWAPHPTDRLVRHQDRDDETATVSGTAAAGIAFGDRGGNWRVGRVVTS